MPLPDPDMYTDWKLWAKAVNLEINRKARVEDNFVAEYSPIETYHNNWGADSEDPPVYAILKNGHVALSGTLVCSTTHTIFTQVCTVPEAARPLTGHNYGTVPMFMTEVSGWFSGTGTYGVFPLFFRTDGIVIGVFTILGGPTYVHLAGITYRGAVSR
jgi:phage major head subunit gpT-like protein